jgi:hypothetical protein
MLQAYIDGEIENAFSDLVEKFLAESREELMDAVKQEVNAMLPPNPCEQELRRVINLIQDKFAEILASQSLTKTDGRTTVI